MVDSLHAAGAAHIVVWNTPDIGVTSSALAANATRPGTSALDTRIALAFNAALSQDLATRSGVITYDVFGLLDAAAADPAAYHFANLSDACGAITGCDPSQYLFWDGIHPTSAGHALIAQGMLAAEPEPSSAALLATGLLFVRLGRRRWVGTRLQAG
jgi:outer membrane lipase/esterase